MAFMVHFSDVDNLAGLLTTFALTRTSEAHVRSQNLLSPPPLFPCKGSIAVYFSVCGGTRANAVAWGAFSRLPYRR